MKRIYFFSIVSTSIIFGFHVFVDLKMPGLDNISKFLLKYCPVFINSYIIAKMVDKHKDKEAERKKEIDTFLNDQVDNLK